MDARPDGWCVCGIEVLLSVGVVGFGPVRLAHEEVALHGGAAGAQTGKGGTDDDDVGVDGLLDVGGVHSRAELIALLDRVRQG